MKVSVYKDEEGKLSVLVQASVGVGLAPILVGEITPGNVVEKVLPVVKSMRRGSVLFPSTPEA